MKSKRNELAKKMYRKPRITSEQANLQALALCSGTCGAGSSQAGSGGIGPALTSILFSTGNS